MRRRTRATRSGFVPAKVPGYTVADLSADWWVAPQVRLLGGVSNLTDRKYYSRVSRTPSSRAWAAATIGAAYEF